MSSITLLLARRYIQSASRKKSISTILYLCSIGIFIATFSLALIISIMQGFEQATYKKLQGIHADIIMQAPGQTINFEALGTLFDHDFSEKIAAYSPSELQNSLINNPSCDSMPLVIMIKGVDPAGEAKTTILEKTIIDTIDEKKTLSELLVNNALLVGDKLAKSLQVRPGDMIELLVPIEEQTKKNAIQLKTINAFVSGIIKTGIEEFDSTMAISNRAFLQKLSSDSAHSFVHISVKPGISPEHIIEQLRLKTGLDVYSWKDLYPPLVAALTLEKYAMFFILSLIVLVASMSIIALISMIITHKRGDIAILQAMGYPQKNIRSIFMLIGMGISFIAASLGLISAWCVGLILKKYPFIQLPDAYFVTHLPITLDFGMFALVFLTVMMLSFLATWIPLQSLKEKNIAHLLRIYT